MKYLLLLLLFLSACDEETPQYGSTGSTDTFLQRMAASAGKTDLKGRPDSTISCETILYWTLLTSDLSKKNRYYDTAIHINRHTYTIAHTSGNEDSMLIWINYKADDTSTIKTMAWLQMDVRSGKLYDVTTRTPVPVSFDTMQLHAIRCGCIYPDKMDNDDSIVKLKRNSDLKMIRNKSYTDAPDYGRVF